MTTMKDVFSAREEDLDSFLEMNQEIKMLVKKIGVCLIAERLSKLNSSDTDLIKTTDITGNVERFGESVLCGVYVESSSLLDSKRMIDDYDQLIKKNQLDTTEKNLAISAIKGGLISTVAKNKEAIETLEMVLKKYNDGNGFIERLMNALKGYNKAFSDISSTLDINF